MTELKFEQLVPLYAEKARREAVEGNAEKEQVLRNALFTRS